MNLNSNPEGQHDLPKTYLKRFVIDANNRELKSLVYCYWKNQFETKIQKVSIDSKRFKKNNFYTIENINEPYVLENLFSKEIEPLYNMIMKEVECETNLSSECRQYLIIWLFINKYRNEANRNTIESTLNFMIQTSYSMEYGIEKFEEIKDKLRKITVAKSKEVHLKSLTQENLFEEFERGIGTKHWMVLKSRPNNKFLTNDNPGFSINVEYAEADLNSLNSFYATNAKASNYFVLSPKYCLLISPFWQGTPLDTSIHNQEIEFKTTNNNHIDFINFSTIKTRSQYLISSTKEQILNYIKIDK